ncbi:MAG: sulfotransferase [Gemmatimonadota bacterium]|nr:sulfotransferase [Gemmatimonadota bacterium]
MTPGERAAAVRLDLERDVGARGPASVTVDAVEPVPRDGERLLGASLDRPTAGQSWPGTNLSLAGWAVGTEVPAVAIDIVHDERVLRKAPLAIHREDVAARHEGEDIRRRCGFRTSISALGLPDPFELRVRFVFDDGGVQELARIRGRHAPLGLGGGTRLSPIGLTTLGRTGSTWLMRLLREHPGIVVHGGYPYETRSAAYWLHMVRVLSDPANPLQSSHPDAFPDDLWTIGHHPFNRETLADEPELEAWFRSEYPRELATLARRSIDAFYLRVAESEGKPAATHFAEKMTPGHIPRLMGELYPASREIILVRDFRDMACSILAFNAKRGFVAFGRENVESDAEFIETNLRVGARRLLESWREREDRALLVRYEDLVLEPERTLGTLCSGLGLDAAPARQVLERAAGESGALDRHRTSRDPRASIGRWREELDPVLAAVCRAAFREALEAFGYELD